MVSLQYPMRARARTPFTLLRQSNDMALQSRIVVQQGHHGAMTVLELGRHVFPGRPDNELPRATLWLAVQDLRKDGLVRRVWLSLEERYQLTRVGSEAHRYLARANWSDLLP